MITGDLIEYIKSELSKNISKDAIISDLTSVGWRVEDINEGFSIIGLSSSAPKLQTKNVDSEEIKEAVNKQEIKKKFDPYRELPEGIDIDQINPYNKPIEEPKKEEVSPLVQENKYKEVESQLSETSDVKNELNIDDEPKSEESKESVQDIISRKYSEEPEPIKIWTPSSIKPKIDEVSEVKKTEPVIFSTEKKIENYNLELEAGEEEKKIQAKNEVLKEEIKKEEVVQPDLIPIINKNPFYQTTNLETKYRDNGDSTSSIDKKEFSFSNQEVAPIVPPKKIPQATIAGTPSIMTDIVPKTAMISSYSQDILAANKEQEIVSAKNGNKFIKLGIIFLVLGLIGGMVFAFFEGYIKIPWSKYSVSVVKKDPKIMILGASDSISKLKSYKVETNINISSPSLSNITTGLSNGEVVTSSDKESVSISAKGVANHVDDKLIFDYLLNFNSSILKNAISSDLKYDGDNFFITVPDLKQILDKDAPAPATVSFKPDQIKGLSEEFSPAVQDIIKKVDVYNIISGEIPPYVKNEITLIFKDFINSLTYTEKGIESIHGVETYHYELTADRQATKKLLTSLSNLLIVSLTPEEKNKLDEGLGSSTISAFDVWVGKNDENLYQIKFTLNAPLSRVLNLNDSGIAGNEVKLDWSTTYYDLDVYNNIIVVNDSLSMENFVNKIKNNKIKNIVSSFKQQTNTLKNAIGSYGSRANPTGSCTNPNPGSLFSPKGHPKGADNAIGLISESLQSLLGSTNGGGLCYSTSKDWAISVPLSPTEESVSSYYCSDNKGITTILQSPITGTACK